MVSLRGDRRCDGRLPQALPRLVPVPSARGGTPSTAHARAPRTHLHASVTGQRRPCLTTGTRSPPFPMPLCLLSGARARVGECAHALERVCVRPACVCARACVFVRAMRAHTCLGQGLLYSRATPVVHCRWPWSRALRACVTPVRALISLLLLRALISSCVCLCAHACVPVRDRVRVCVCVCVCVGLRL